MSDENILISFDWNSKQKEITNCFKWHYASFRGNNTHVCANLKVKISVYFVTSMFCFILNTVQQNQIHDMQDQIT